MATAHNAQPVAVVHPVTGMHQVISKGMDFPDDDPIVAAAPWAFEAPEENSGPVESVPIEDLTARPGARRNTRRR
jgi:hypothetical protein